MEKTYVVEGRYDDGWTVVQRSNEWMSAKRVIDRMNEVGVASQYRLIITYPEREP